LARDEATHNVKYGWAGVARLPDYPQQVPWPKTWAIKTPVAELLSSYLMSGCETFQEGMVAPVVEEIESEDSSDDDAPLLTMQSPPKKIKTKKDQIPQKPKTKSRNDQSNIDNINEARREKERLKEAEITKQTEKQKKKELEKSARVEVISAERDKLAAERDKLAAELESKNEEIKTLKESYNIMIELHASEKKKKKKKKKEMIQERHRQEVQGLYNQLAAVQDRVEAVRDVTNYHVADLQFAAFRGYSTASDSSAMLNSRPQDPPTTAGGPLPADRIFNFFLVLKF
jgi:hypothetical protein